MRLARHERAADVAHRLALLCELLAGRNGGLLRARELLQRHAWKRSIDHVDWHRFAPFDVVAQPSAFAEPGQPLRVLLSKLVRNVPALHSLEMTQQRRALPTRPRTDERAGFCESHVVKVTLVPPHA